MILPLDTPSVSIETVGGKALNLSRLARKGFPVPEGDLIPVAAYLRFCEENHLAAKIAGCLTGASLEHPAVLESSQTIRGWFDQGTFPIDLEENPVCLHLLGSPRGSRALLRYCRGLARGLFCRAARYIFECERRDKLLQAVVKCWSSLWTGRAIGYRQRNGIGQAELGLAVIVQEMVHSQVSGVVFTANPLTGRRTEMVIDATLGLGEALVAGKVEPDHYVVDMRGPQVTTNRSEQRHS